MSQNSNLGYTGYLLRKTVQPYSLRKENSNYNEFREKNMIMYINKKVSNTREREGRQLSTQSLQKGIHLMVRKDEEKNRQSNKNGDDDISFQEEKDIDIKQLQREEEKERKDPFYLDVILSMKQNEYKDDFQITSEENANNTQIKSRKERSNIEETLSLLVSDNFNPTKIKELFLDYKKISLKDKLNDLKSKHVDMAQIQRKIKKNSHKIQDLEDSEKVNKFMTQICSQKNLTLGKILEINEDLFKYIEGIQYNQEDHALDQIPKAKALQMLEQLIEGEEEDNQKTMIKIFKKTQLDVIDSDVPKNKFNMTSFKKKNEQTEKLFQKMAQDNKKAILNAMKDPSMDSEKFAKRKNKMQTPCEYVNVFDRLVSNDKKPVKLKPSQLSISVEQLQTKKDVIHNKLKEVFLNLRNDSVSSITQSTQDNSKYQQYIKSLYKSTSTHSSIPLQYANTFQTICSPVNYTSVTNQGQTFFNTSNQLTQSNQHISTDFNSTYTKSSNVKQTINKGSFNPFNQNIQKRQFFAINKIEKNNKEIYIQKNRILKLQEDNQLDRAKQLQMAIDKKEMQEYAQQFLQQCDKTKKIQGNQSIQVYDKIKELENIIDEQLKEANQIQQGQIKIQSKVENPNFVEFIKRAEFKRKLITHLISKVDKKSDIYSKFKSKQFTQNYLQKLNEKDAFE